MIQKFFLIVLALIAIAACIAYFVFDGSREVKDLSKVAIFITPEEYKATDRVFTLQTTDKGQRKALLPNQFKTGAYTRKPVFMKQEGYVGPESCKECHAKYYEGFIQTAHYHTSALANKDSILGSFEPGENVMKTKQPGFRFKLEAKEGNFYQTLLVDENDTTYEHSARFDIVTGSGNVGQTYLYWQDEFLFQLPVSWISDGDRWINSPSYPDGLANFARPVNEKCLACHATNIEFAEKRLNLVNRDHKMILGVTCERCHGPAESHVKCHRENPDANAAKFIVHPNDLSRERMNDICSQCHAGGESLLLQPAFSFRPGDPLSSYKRFRPVSDSVGGVHTANQHPRLVRSECYLKSDTMNCATCHNPHQNEHGNILLFSQRCQKCHEMQDCGQFKTSGTRIGTNCIDCHMQKKDDTKLEIETEDEVIFPKVRDHFIRVNKEATQEVLDAWLAEEK